MKITPKLFLAALTLTIISFMHAQKAEAATLSVPAQYGSISAAVNAAKNGDSIAVGPGTYREQVAIVNKYVTVYSTSGDPNNTIIAPNAGLTAFMIQQVPYKSGIPRVKVSGFKITGANYVPDGQGGAFTVANNADPIIEKNVIDHNHTNVDGGGILVFNNSNPSILNNSITYNSASRFGGGIFVVKNCAPTIYGNTINNNTVSGASIPGGGSSGGGLYLENNTSDTNATISPIISNNTISNNTADFAGGAISLRVGVAPVIENNTIDSNRASYGGGIHSETEGAGPVIANNTISNNTASLSNSFAGSGYGGGISVYASSTPKITHNQIVGNAASRGGGGIVLAENSNSVITSNVIGGNYVADTGTYEGGGIYIANARASITNNVVRDNTANLGGGVALLDNSTSTIFNNTIVRNNATYTGAPGRAAGGGIFVRNNGSAITSAAITNNILSLNKNYQVFEEYKKATFANNLIANDNSGIYYNYNTGAITAINTFNGNTKTNAASNISGDAQFTNATGNDYSLTPSSPAIDTATNIGSPPDDYRRAQRPFNGTSDIGAYEYTTETSFKAPVYRFWSSEYSGHFFTRSESEKNTLLSTYPTATWHYEFEAYDAFATQSGNTTPVYRFYSSLYRSHFYTIDSGEKDYIIANYPDSTWHYEGVAYYVYPSSFNASNAVPVFRFWSPSYSHHFYTSSQAEHDAIVRNYPSNIWTDEGVRFKVPR